VLKALQPVLQTRALRIGRDGFGVAGFEPTDLLPPEPASLVVVGEEVVAHMAAELGQAPLEGALDQLPQP
jgi:hypothetical protein